MFTIDQNENVIVLILILNAHLSFLTKKPIFVTYCSSDEGIDFEINIKPLDEKLTIFYTHEQIQDAFENDRVLKEMIEELVNYL